MIEVKLTSDEKEALRRLYDPESKEPVSLEAIESLVRKGILYAYKNRKPPKDGIDFTDLGESVCKRLFGSRQDEFDFSGAE